MSLVSSLDRCVRVEEMPKQKVDKVTVRVLPVYLHSGFRRCEDLPHKMQGLSSVMCYAP